MNQTGMNIFKRWKTVPRAAGAGCLALLLAAAAFAEETPPAPSPVTGGYDAFRLVVERNIFNASRQKPEVVRAAREKPEDPKITQLTLIGTLITEASSYAFFAGTETEFNGVRELGDRIAGWVLTGIRSDGISLAGGGPDITLEVGKGMRRQEPGDWEPSTGMEFVSRPDTSITQNQRGAEEPGRSAEGSRRRSGGTGRRSSAAGSEIQAESAPDAGGTPDADLIKRMMEKRRQELNP